MDTTRALPERPRSEQLDLREFDEHLRTKRERHARQREHDLDLSLQLVRIAEESAAARPAGPRH
jgi:hypothetical protein